MVLLTQYSIPFSIIYYTTLGYSFQDTLSFSNYVNIYSEDFEIKIRDMYYAFSMGSKPIALFYGYYIPVFGAGVNHGYTDLNFDPVYSTSTPSSFKITLLPSLSYSEKYLYGLGIKLSAGDFGNYFFYISDGDNSNYSSVNFYCQWILSLFGNADDTEIISGLSYYLNREIALAIRTFKNTFTYYFFLQSDIGTSATFTVDSKILTVVYNEEYFYFINSYLKLRLGNFAFYHSYRQYDETVMYEYPSGHCAGLYFLKGNFLFGFYYSENSYQSLLYAKVDKYELIDTIYGYIYFSYNILHWWYEYKIKIEYKVEDILTISLENESIYFLHLYFRFILSNENERLFLDFIAGINMSDVTEDYYLIPSYIQHDYLCLRINQDRKWMSFGLACKNSITMYIKIILLFSDNVINQRLYAGFLADI